MLKQFSARELRELQKSFDKQYYTDSDGYLVERQRVVAPRVTAAPRRTAPRRTRGANSRSSAKSGDGNSDDGDPDPERNPLALLDQPGLADLLGIAKSTLQNIYSSTPHALPAAISIPGARGPRWTVQAVQAWLESRPAHSTKPAPVAPVRKVGRPRLAVLRVGGAK